MLSTLHGSCSALPICRWVQQGQSQSGPCPGSLTAVRNCITVLELHPGAVRVLALVTPPPTGLSQFFPLLFITALGPWPAWLPPAISPYLCSGSQPWALWRQSSLGPLRHQVEGWCAGPLERTAGAKLSWSGLFLFPSQWPLEALEVLSVPRWGTRKGCVVSSQPCS